MKTKAKLTFKKPLEIKRGNVTVKVYAGQNRVNGAAYEQFTVVWYDGTERRKKRFADLEAAKAEAELAAVKLASGEGQVLRLTSLDRADYVRAVEMLRPFSRSLSDAVSEYVEVLKMLPAGVTLRHAISDYSQRQNSIRESRTVKDLVVEYIAGKVTAGKSEAHLRDIRLRMTRFGEAFQMPVAQVTAKMVQTWLDGMDVSSRTKLNELRHVSALLRYAVRRKYAPRDMLDELQGIERPEVKPSPTLIFTPDELRELFSAAKPALVPWLAIGAFCGLRAAEILRLDWRDVNLKRRFVEIKAGNSKTAQRRLVPLCDAAIAWLAPLAKPEGRVACHFNDNWFYKDLTDAVNTARKKAGTRAKFAWKRNGLRHSFCSYRIALTGDVARTALEAGNSAGMIFKHYRELASEEEAQAWFNTMPPAEQNNIVPMPKAAATA